MKRIIAFVLSILLVLSFSACGKKKTTSNSTTAESTSKFVDEGLLTVKFTMPAFLFTDASPATDKLTDDQKAQGFKSAKINKDGSVTYTMSKSDYKKYKKKIAENTEKNINDCITEYDSFKSVEFNDDFSKITVTVNKNEYENSMDGLAIMAIGMSAQLYQACAGKDIEDVKCTINVCDDNGKQFDSVTYPLEDE